MSKIKILSVGESSYLHSGYGRYNNGLLTELHKNPNYELYEFGLFYNPTFNQAGSIPWKFIPNILPEHRLIDSQEKLESWKNWTSNPINNLGGPLFNSVLLEVQPDIVIANNDEWNLKYIIDSPFKRFFKTVCLFACDSIPQKMEWIDSMSKCDGVLTYSDWAKEEIEKQSPKIKIYSSAPPSCQPEFQPLNREAVRASFNIDKQAKIIGTVMRNQPRKQFPLLFQSFAKYLEQEKANNTYLWVHSRFPDNSWLFPQLIAESGVSSRILFTYFCTQCNFIYPSCYQDTSQCPKCLNVAGIMPGTSHGISSEELCKVYNAFDVMCLLSNSEGFGLPTVEAAACGVPVMVTDYAAMRDVVTTLGAEAIKVSSYYKELSTGQDKAVPDENHLIELWTKFFNKPESIRRAMGMRARINFEKHYSWEKAAKTWQKLIDVVYEPSNWYAPLQINQPAEMTNQPMSNTDFARWLINNVACQPDKLCSVYENELIRNLTYQCRANAQNNGVTAPFNRELAYSEARHIGEFRKNMEIARGKVLNVSSKQ